MTNLRKSNRSYIPFALCPLLLLLSPFLCYSGVSLYNRLYWRYQQADVIRQVERYAYPTAVVSGQKVSVVRGMTSDWCIVTAYLTFTTLADFNDVTRWYEAHPEGISYDEGGGGLDLLNKKTTTDGIEYGVRYQRWIGAWFCPVTDP